MDRDVIKSLIEALAASDLAELEYSSNGETLRLVKAAAAPLPAPAPSRPAGEQTVVAPLYGIVHLQQAPDAPPFVVAGQPFAAGQVLCVIEAMKVFNQVRAERDGIIAAVLVQSGQEVEAGEPLFQLG